MKKHLLYPLAVLAAALTPVVFAAQSVQLSHWDIAQTLNQNSNPSTKNFSQRTLRAPSAKPVVYERDLVQNLRRSAGVGYQLKTLGDQQTGANNLRHQRYQQYYQDLPVWGQQVVVHADKRGRVSKLNGSMAKNIQLPPAGVNAALAKFTGKAMLEHAIKLHAQTLEVKSQQLVLSDQQSIPYIYINSDDQQARVVYYVSFFHRSEIVQSSKPAYLIDAVNKTVIRQWDDLKTAEATGPGGNEKTGKYHYGTDKPAMQVNQSTDVCFMQSDDFDILEYKFRSFDAFGFVCGENTHYAINGAYSPLNDTHFATARVFQMYNDWYQMSPLTQKVRVKVHSGETTGAYWNDGEVHIGDGNDKYYPFSSLDVVSHEIAHGFTDKYSDLFYWEESGGINESFSDIAGEAAEYFVNGSNDWLTGGEITKNTPALRYFDDPTKDGLSIDHYDQFYSRLDVHYSSGLFNKAFYLLANTDGWDVQKAFTLFVDANKHYWTWSTTFAQGACGVINAADDLLYNSIDVDNAFVAVGVYCNNLPVVDTDGDGLPDLWELRFGFNPDNAQDAALDDDNDGLSNLTEFTANTRPDISDTDKDSLSDGDEVNIHLTNPLIADTDGDEMPDSWEVQHGLDPLVKNTLDTDGDEFSDFDEYKMGTLPNDDTSQPLLILYANESFESEGLPTGWSIPKNAIGSWTVDNSEAHQGGQSLRAEPGKISLIQWTGYFGAGELAFAFKGSLADTRAGAQISIDGYSHYNSLYSTENWTTFSATLTQGIHTIEWSNYYSRALGDNWLDSVRYFATGSDVDNDGLYDGWEFAHGLDDTNAQDAGQDPDQDGLTNLAEYNAGTDPNLADSDGDGLSDGDEHTIHGTNPNEADSDGDGMPDGWEVQYGLEPKVAGTDIDSDNDGMSDFVEFETGTDPKDNTAQTTPIQSREATFENGIKPDYLVNNNEHARSWQVTSERSKEGIYALAAPDLRAGQMAVVEWTGYFEAGRLSYDLFGLMTDYWDGMFLVIDGKAKAIAYTRWFRHSESLTEGLHTIRFEYTKNGRLGGETSEQGVWLDNLVFIADGLDSDGDGLTDQVEYDKGLDRNNPLDANEDWDGDGLTNSEEIGLFTLINNADSDGDGLSDGDEVNIHQTNPWMPDSDQDGMPDGWELEHGMDPLLKTTNRDTDGDGFVDKDEYKVGTSPNDANSAPEWFNNLLETFENNTIPTFLRAPDNAQTAWAISTAQHQAGEYSLMGKNDTLDNTVILQWWGFFESGMLLFDHKMLAASSRLEIFIDAEYDSSKIAKKKVSTHDWESFSRTLSKGLHLVTVEFTTTGDNAQLDDAAWIDNIRYIGLDVDNDNDGMTDVWERQHGLDFTDPDDAAGDIDNDGLTNLEEYLIGSNLYLADTDGDGVGDGTEVKYGYDPLQSNDFSLDSDGDGFSDLVEINLGLSPIDSLDVWVDDDEDRLPLVLELLEGTNPQNKDNDVFSNHRLLVNLAFGDFAGRIATDDEVTFWTGELASGNATPLDVYRSLMSSDVTSKLSFIGRVYQATLGRYPDAQGVRFYLHNLGEGIEWSQMVEMFVNSAEFQQKYGELSNAQFVQLVYRNVLDRDADADGLVYWTGALDDNSASRLDMMFGFIESLEFKNATDEVMKVQLLSLVLTGQLPTPSRLAQYVDWSKSAAEHVNVVKALLAGNDYRNSLLTSDIKSTDDTDSDGIPNGVEFVYGTDVNVKDNDISTDDSLFVKQTLRDMVGEVWPDFQISAQLEVLSTAGSRTDWVKSLMSDERVTTKRQAINRLYSAFFLRQPDHSGLMYWVGRHEEDMSLNQIAEFFVSSDEFQTRYGDLSNSDFVTLVYQNLFDRVADTSGFNYWLGRLDDESLTRGGLMTFFSEADENLGLTFHQSRVVTLFNLLYRRSANDAEFTQWHDAFMGGTDARVLIDEILASNEYLGRFY